MQGIVRSATAVAVCTVLSVFSLGTISMANAASAEVSESGGDKFRNIDDMLKGLTDVSRGTSKKSRPVYQRKAIDVKPGQENSKGTPSLVKVQVPQGRSGTTQNVTTTLPLQKTSSPRQLEVLNTRLTEIPPNSRFEFKDNLFIPAYKAGVLYRAGTLVNMIEQDANIYTVMSSLSSEQVNCALLSDKSYLLMRGIDDNSTTNPERKPPTHLDVKDISIMEGSTSTDTSGVLSRLFYKVDFHPKAAGGDDTVNITVVCSIPKHLTKEPRNYRLKDFNHGVGGLFNYVLPKYIEI
jgi:hypothetical protein